MPVDIKPIQIDDPNESMGRMLNNAFLMDKIGAGRIEREQNAMLNRVARENTDPTGKTNWDKVRYGLAQNNQGAYIPTLDKQRGEVDHLASQTKAQEASALASKHKALGDYLNTRKEFTLGLSDDPAVGLPQYEKILNETLPIFAEVAGPERAAALHAQDLAAAKQAAATGKWGQYRSYTQNGAKVASEQHVIQTNAGDRTEFRSYPAHAGSTAQPLTNLGSTPTGKNPNASSGHWVEDYNPVTKQVTHRIATPGMPTTPRPPAVSPQDRAMAAEFKSRAQAASLIATQLNTKIGGGMFVVNPDTGDIEIKGGQPMSPVAQRRIDMLAGKLGGYIETVPGQNPRVVLNNGTTLGSVQGILRDQGNLVFERGPNGVERLVHREEGVERRPVEPKKVDPVKLKMKAQADANAMAKTLMIFDQREIEQMADHLYQEYLSTEGAGYAGPDAATKLLEEMKADREARRRKK